MTTDLESQIRTTLHTRAEAIRESDLDGNADVDGVVAQPRSRGLLVGVAAAIAALAGGLALTLDRTDEQVMPSSQPPAAVFVSTARYVPTVLPDGWKVTGIQDVAMSNAGAGDTITQTWLGPVDEAGDTPVVIQVRGVPVANVDPVPSDQLLPNIVTTGTGVAARVNTAWVDGDHYHFVGAEGADEALVRAFTDRLRADPQRPGYVQLIPTLDAGEPDPLGDLVPQNDQFAPAPALTWGTTVTIGGPDAASATVLVAPRARDSKHLEMYAADGIMINPGQRASVITGDDDVPTLSWTNGTTVFTLSGDLPIETLASIASSIEPTDDTTWATMQQAAADDYLASAGAPDLTGAVSDMTVSVYEAGDATTLCSTFTDGTKRCSTYDQGSDLRAAVAVRDRTAIIYGWTGGTFTASSGGLTVNDNRIDATDIDGQQIYAFPLPRNATEITICRPTSCGSILGFG
jgi:hypothetical protein